MHNELSFDINADHVSIGVQDYEASVAWYRDKLGFVVEKEWTVDGLLGVRLAYLKGAGFRIEITAGGARHPRRATD